MDQVNIQRRMTLMKVVKMYHEGQLRKHTSEPYHRHLLRVANRAEAALHPDRLIWEVAYCHDLIEDTWCTYNLLVETLRALGYSDEEVAYIYKGVYALTDQYTSESYPNSNRKARKDMEVVRLEKILPSFQTIKYADILDNIKNLKLENPKFADVYFEEKSQIMKVMNKGNKSLYSEIMEILDESNP